MIEKDWNILLIELDNFNNYCEYCLKNDKPVERKKK